MVGEGLKIESDSLSLEVSPEEPWLPAVLSRPDWHREAEDVAEDSTDIKGTDSDERR